MEGNNNNGTYGKIVKFLVYTMFAATIAGILFLLGKYVLGYFVPFIIAFIIAVMNAIGIKTRQRKLVEEGCDGRCDGCASVCVKSKGGADK